MIFNGIKNSIGITGKALGGRSSLSNYNSMFARSMASLKNMGNTADAFKKPKFRGPANIKPTGMSSRGARKFIT